MNALAKSCKAVALYGPSFDRSGFRSCRGTLSASRGLSQNRMVEAVEVPNFDQPRWRKEMDVDFPDFGRVSEGPTMA